MRVLVLGGSGMLGHKVFQYARARFDETWCTVRGRREDSGLDRIGLGQPERAICGNVDAMEWDTVDGVLQELRPDAVVNCLGIIKQRADAKAALPSIAINALLPHRIAAALAAWNGRLIHISTDCVFSGTRGGYTEDDVPDAQDLYGRSKLLGEVTDGNAITLRTSMIGRELREHRSLLDWVIGQNGRTIKGYRRALFSGLTTNELARVICEVVERHPRLSGLYHVTSDTITKYDLLRLIVETFGLDIRVEPEDGFFCDRSMVGVRFAAATGYRCPVWPQLMGELRADPTPYQSHRNADETV